MKVLQLRCNRPGVWSFNLQDHLTISNGWTYLEATDNKKAVVMAPTGYNGKRVVITHGLTAKRLLHELKVLTDYYKL